MKALDLVRYPAVIIIPIIVYLGAPGDISPKAPLFMALTSAAVMAWALNVFPAIGVAALLTFAYMLGNVAPAEVVFGPWATVLPWITFAAVIIGDAMDKSGLGRRLALRCISITGVSFWGLMVGFFLAGIVLALILPSILARLVIFCAISIGIIDTLGIDHKSRASSAIILLAFMASAAPQFLFLHTSESFIWAFSMLLKDGMSVDFWDYVLHGSLFSILYTIMSMLVCRVVLGREKLMANEHAREYIANGIRSLGPISPKEYRLIALSVCMVLGFMLQPWTGVDPVYIFCVLALCCYLPGFGVLKPESIENLQVMFLIFVAGCMAIGFVGGAVGFNTWAVHKIIPFMQDWGQTMSIMMAYVSGIVVNFLLTPFAATAAFTPALGELGQAMHVNPLPLFYAFQYGVDQYVLPYEAVYFLYIFVTNRVSLWHIAGALIIRAILCGLMLALIAIPYWGIIGIM